MTQPDHESDTHAALGVDQLTKSFGGIHALNGVTFTVEPGEIVGLIGPNGSGKSTLFNVTAGQLAPDGGRVALDGRDITGQKAWRVARAGLGRTFQIPSLFDNMTVLDNLRAAAAECNWRNAPERAREALELLKIDHVADQNGHELSGGQQKLVEFARVYMRDPKVVLLDEVTAGVHYSIRRIILDAVAHMRGMGRTFLLIEHDMELVREVSERILVMHQGELVATGTFEEIARDEQVQKAYLGRRS